LMDELEARLKARGCLKALLIVHSENLGVIGFYEHRGWEVMDVLLMGKEFDV